jgi:hypothetical protein
MDDPRLLLALLLGVAIGLGGVLQGLQWKNTTPNAGQEGDARKIAALESELSMVKRENDALRSLAQGGGEVAVLPEWISHVESELGLNFLSSPVVHRIAREELRDRVVASIESRLGPSGMDDRQAAFELLGLIEPGVDLLTELATARAVIGDAWFDSSSGEAWVTDRFDAEAVPSQAVVLKLLGRILLHQHAPPQVDPSDDAAWAREALHEGVALGIEQRYLAKRALDSGFLPPERDKVAENIRNALSPMVKTLLDFTQQDGKAFADTLHVAGKDELRKALRHAALSTHEVVTRRVQPPTELPRLAPGDDEVYLRGSLGMLGLRACMANRPGSSPPMDAITEAWRADHFEFFADGETDVAVAWLLVFSDEAAAGKWEEILQLTRHGDESRVIRVVRRGKTEVLLINCASETLAKGIMTP